MALGPRIGDRHHHGEGGAVGARGEPLAAVEHVAVAVATRRCVEPGRVRAGPCRLGEREAAADAAGGERHQEALALPGARVLEQQLQVADVRRLAVAGVVADRRAAEQAGDVGEVGQRHAHAAELARQRWRPQTLRAHPFAHPLEPLLDGAEAGGEEVALERLDLLAEEAFEPFQQRPQVGRRIPGEHRAASIAARRRDVRPWGADREVVSRVGAPAAWATPAMGGSTTPWLSPRSSVERDAARFRCLLP